MSLLGTLLGIIEIDESWLHLAHCRRDFPFKAGALPSPIRSTKRTLARSDFIMLYDLSPTDDEGDVGTLS